jgi:hypothetical protein
MFLNKFYKRKLGIWNWELLYAAYGINDKMWYECISPLSRGCKNKCLNITTPIPLIYTSQLIFKNNFLFLYWFSHLASP